MKKAMKVAILLGTGLLATALLGQDKVATSDSGKAPETQSAKPASPEPQGSWNAPDYVIGADDTLHISVWKEPDLTETLAGAS